MAYGDVGGAVTELVITCKTPQQEDFTIAAGDPVGIANPYTVTVPAENQPIFGQALANAAGPNVTLPVKVRGICIFRYSGPEPDVGTTGVVASSERGTVTASSAGRGIIVKADIGAGIVHVLL